jgi:hypothetical protein
LDFSNRSCRLSPGSSAVPAIIRRYISVAISSSSACLSLKCQYRAGALTSSSLAMARRVRPSRPSSFRSLSTLVAVGVEAPQLPEAIKVVHGASQVSYGEGLFLVRPDGYVGWTGGTAAGLKDHLVRAGLQSGTREHD